MFLGLSPGGFTSNSQQLHTRTTCALLDEIILSIHVDKHNLYPLHLISLFPIDNLANQNSTLIFHRSFGSFYLFLRKAETGGEVSQLLIFSYYLNVSQVLLLCEHSSISYRWFSRTQIYYQICCSVCCPYSSRTIQNSFVSSLRLTQR